MSVRQGTTTLSLRCREMRNLGVAACHRYLELVWLNELLDCASQHPLSNTGLHHPTELGSITPRAQRPHFPFQALLAKSGLHDLPYGSKSTAAEEPRAVLESHPLRHAWYPLTACTDMIPSAKEYKDPAPASTPFCFGSAVGDTIMLASGILTIRPAQNDSACLRLVSSSMSRPAAGIQIRLQCLAPWAWQAQLAFKFVSSAWHRGQCRPSLDLV